MIGCATHGGVDNTDAHGALGDRVFFLGSDGAWLTAADVHSGEVSWTVQFETGIVDIAYVEDSSGSHVIACATGAGNVCGLSPTDGRRVWSRTPPAARPSDEMRRYESHCELETDWGAATGDRPVRFIDAADPSTLSLIDTAQETVTALEHETGLERWQVFLPDYDVQLPTRAVTVADDTVYAVNPIQASDFHNPIQFTSIDAQAGALHWQNAVEGPFSRVRRLVVSERFLLATFMNGSLHFSRDTGEYLLQEEASPSVYPAGTSAQGVVLTTCDGSIAGIDAIVLE